MLISHMLSSCTDPDTAQNGTENSARVHGTGSAMYLKKRSRVNDGPVLTNKHPCEWLAYASSSSIHLPRPPPKQTKHQTLQRHGKTHKQRSVCKWRRRPPIYLRPKSHQFCPVRLPSTPVKPGLLPKWMNGKLKHHNLLWSAQKLNTQLTLRSTSCLSQIYDLFYCLWIMFLAYTNILKCQTPKFELRVHDAPETLSHPRLNKRASPGLSKNWRT